MTRTSLPRPWRSRASFSSAPSDPMALSASMPNCRRISATTAAPKSPRRKAKQASVDRTRRIGKPLKHTNGREREEAKAEAARQKEREHRQRAVDKAQTALDEAEREHMQRADSLRSEIEAIEKKLKAEDADWENQEGWLKAALRRARE